MKIRVVNYSFDASAQTVTFSDFTAISLEGVLMIVNVTDQIIIYNFADSTKGGTVSTNVLTLEHDTTSMSDTDDLLIYYDDGLNNKAYDGIITEEFTFTDANGAQTNFALVTVGSGAKIIVKMIDVTCDNANTVDVGVRIGLHASALSSVSTSGVEGIVLSHPGIAPGSGIVKGNGEGIIAIGSDGQDLRITSEDPVGGSIRVVVTYKTITA